MNITAAIQVIRWSTLTAEQQTAALRRPVQPSSSDLLPRTQHIIDTVRVGGDAALQIFTEQFDGVALDSCKVTAAEFTAATSALTAAQHTALQRAIDNVQRFHAAQVSPPLRVEIEPGVVCEQQLRAIDAVGLYVPAGTAPLPSTAIMLAVPARIAQCPVRILCTPPRRDGSADPAILVAAQHCDVTAVFKVGGAQAIAAMAFGTASIPKVNKIFGPGNRWVTAAKQLVAHDPDGAALDLPAGPSEVLVIADHTAHAEFVAADLLAQAEHSADAQAICICTTTQLAQQVGAALLRQSALLSRSELLRQSHEHIRLIVVDTVATAIAISNCYAPEHLILQLEHARQHLAAVSNAGSVFLGAWTPETMGDYCSGTNHVLPTYGFARNYSGLSLSDFMKRMTVQELSATGLQTLGPTAATLAQMEGLDAHAQAVQIRLNHLAGRDNG